MSDRTPERVIPAGRWRQFATMIGSIFAVFVGRRADERASDAEYEASVRLWTRYVDGKLDVFTGTPEEHRRYLKETK